MLPEYLSRYLNRKKRGRLYARLHEATRDCNADLMKQLLSTISSIEHLDYWDEREQRLGLLLNQVACGGYRRPAYELDKEYSAARVLLGYGADPNTRDENGSTPVIKFASGSDDSWSSSADEPMRFIELLRHNGADLNARDNLEGFTALHWAAFWSYHTRVCEALLRAGANPNIADKKERTPLHIAIKNFPSSYDDEGYRSGTEDKTEVLIKYGANIDAQDEDGRTPLHYAAIQVSDSSWDNFGVAVETLLKAGALSQTRDKHGQSPIDLLNDEGKVKIKPYLRIIW